MRRTAPGDLFFQAGWPGVYLPLQLRNPLYLDIAYAIRPEEAERVIQELQTTNVPLILWTAHLDAPCVSNRPCDKGTSILRDYPKSPLSVQATNFLSYMRERGV